MDRVHAEARNFDLKYQTASGAVIPFHPGALRYFKERGLSIK
jgi:TRAP-type uncharacterized transport system substrate-binding protein